MPTASELGRLYSPYQFEVTNANSDFFPITISNILSNDGTRQMCIRDRPSSVLESSSTTASEGLPWRSGTKRLLARPAALLEEASVEKAC